ncbi:cell wall-binding repeat-containing protein [Kytococcus sp. Marseille-QA3725]
MLNTASRRTLSALGVMGLSLGMVPTATGADAPAPAPETTTKKDAAPTTKDGAERYIVTMQAPSVVEQQGTAYAAGSSAAKTMEQSVLASQEGAIAAVAADPTYQYATVLNGFSASLTQDQVETLRARGDVASVTQAGVRELADAAPQNPFKLASGKVRPSTHESVDVLDMRGEGGLWEQVGGPMNAGKGVVVGVIDTGITPKNDSFSGEGMPDAPSGWQGSCDEGADAARWSAADCSNKVIGARAMNAGVKSEFPLAEYESDSPYDVDGHGSHTGSTAAGREVALSNGQEDFAIAGMAPGAHVSAYKACWQYTGSDGDTVGCFEEDLVASIDAAVKDGVDVINASLGSADDPAYSNTPGDEAFRRAADAGVFVAAAAGNDGPVAEEPYPVSNGMPWAATVGAASHHEEDTDDGPVPSITGFSQRGPVNVAPEEQNLLKPDIGAPGLNVLAADGDDSWGFNSGTSMATPHVSGVAAAVVGARPDWSPMAVRSALQTTTTPYAGEDSNIPFNGGSGFLNGKNVLNPGVVFDSGAADWDAFLANPAEGHQMNNAAVVIGQLKADAPTAVTRKLTGTAEGEVTWKATYEGPETLKVDAPDVTVAQGQTAETEITVANTGAPENEWQHGWITYSAEGQADVRVPVVARGAVTEEPDPDRSLTRLSGADRYATAARLTEGAQTDTVYLASGEDYPDALTGSTAAASGVKSASGNTQSMPEDLPILLTRQDSLPKVTREALQNTGAKKVVVVGGKNAVSAGVEAELKAMGITVERIGGEDRYETSANVAKSFGTGIDTLYVASGEDRAYADALAGSALAGSQDVPVLLTDPNNPSATTIEAAQAVGAKKVVVLGGKNAVSEAAAQKLGATERVSGADRYATSVAIASQFGDHETTYFATGEDYPDSLTGGAVAAAWDSPLLLTRQASLPGTVAEYVKNNPTDHNTIFGGTAAVSTNVENQLKTILGIN